MRKKFKIRLVDMCIYIDNNVYKPGFDENLIFEYLQNLYYSLSMKKRFFSTEKDYENYSLYSATETYLRLINPKQFLPDDNPKKLKPIKSVLNFIKRCLYAFKVNYQNDSFNTIYNNNFNGTEVNSTLYDYFNEKIKNQNGSFLNTDIECYIEKILVTIKNIIKGSPFVTDKLSHKNIYMSCLLTLLRSMTLSNINKKRLYKKDSEDMKLNIDNNLEKSLYEESINAPIVWHLDEGLKSYIAVLVNEIKKVICDDIKQLIDYYEPSDDLIKDILLAPLAELNDKEVE